MPSTNRELLQTRLRAFCTQPEVGCWEWTAGKNNKGYGRLWWNGRPRLAHRLAYDVWRGPVPEHLNVLHRCDNPACIRPDHLFLGTTADNNEDSKSKGRNAHGERHARAKLSEAEVLDLRKSTLNISQLARQFSLDRKTVRDAKTGRTWRHLRVEEQGG